MNVKIKKTLNPKKYQYLKKYNFYSPIYKNGLYGDQIASFMLGNSYELLELDCVNTIKIKNECGKLLYIDLCALTKESQKEVVNNLGKWKLILIDNIEVYVNKKTKKFVLLEESLDKEININKLYKYFSK